MYQETTDIAQAVYLFSSPIFHGCHYEMTEHRSNNACELYGPSEKECRVLQCALKQQKTLRKDWYGAWFSRNSVAAGFHLTMVKDLGCQNSVKTRARDISQV
jgi:hypothetical protein